MWTFFNDQVGEFPSKKRDILEFTVEKKGNLVLKEMEILNFVKNTSYFMHWGAERGIFHLKVEKFACMSADFG